MTEEPREVVELTLPTCLVSIISKEVLSRIKSNGIDVAATHVDAKEANRLAQVVFEMKETGRCYRAWLKEELVFSCLAPAPI